MTEKFYTFGQIKEDAEAIEIINGKEVVARAINGNNVAYKFRDGEILETTLQG